MVVCWAQTLCLKDDPALIAKYEHLHANCWPEVLEALKAVGVLSMKIFRKGTRMFMYVETVDGFDPAVDFPRHLELSPKAVEWGKLCSSMQVPAPEAGQGDWWTYMDEVYDFQSQYRKFKGANGPMDLGVAVGAAANATPAVVKPGKVTLTQPLSDSPTRWALVPFAMGIVVGAAAVALLKKLA